MDDQQRLDQIVKWMHEVGDPWMRDASNGQPKPNSDFEADDSQTPGCSAVSHRGIVMALDHLGAVVDAVVRERPKRLKAHFTVLRTALHCGTRVRWLLEPDSSTERQIRAIEYKYENLVERRSATNDLKGTQLDGQSAGDVQRDLSAIDAEEASLTKQVLGLGATHLKKPLDVVGMLKKNFNFRTDEGVALIRLWRTGSASAHGHYWDDQHRNNPGQFDYQWFQPAIHAATLQINEAMKLHHKRLTTRTTTP